MTEIQTEPASYVPTKGHVYVVEFGSGTIKVGQSTQLPQRMGHYGRRAAIHGDEVVNTWASVAHVNYQANEAALIQLCTANGQIVAGREYFRGLSFGRVESFAKTLTFDETATPIPCAPGGDARFNGLTGLYARLVAGLPANADEANSIIRAGVAMSDAELRAFSRWRARRDWAERTKLRRAMSSASPLGG